MWSVYLIYIVHTITVNVKTFNLHVILGASPHARLRFSSACPSQQIYEKWELEADMWEQQMQTSRLEKFTCMAASRRFLIFLEQNWPHNVFGNFWTSLKFHETLLVHGAIRPIKYAMFRNNEYLRRVLRAHNTLHIRMSWNVSPKFGYSLCFNQSPITSGAFARSGSG